MFRTLCALMLGILPEIAFAQARTFEVASVKLLSPDIPKTPLYSGGPSTSDPGRLHLRVNMSLLLVAAFDISADQIKGPAWLRDFSAMPFYDINATMPLNTTKEQVEEMLQNLLVERFHLDFHREKGSFPGYELVVNKSGPKLKEVAPDGNPAIDSSKAAALGTDGFPTIAGPKKMGWRPSAAHQRIKYQEWSMLSFAKDLGFLMGQSSGKSLDDGFFQPRVIDKTGLAGKYTFILEYDCPACAPLVSTPPSRQDAGNVHVGAQNEPGSFPDIFGAIQKQLGLQVKKTSDVQMDVIVITALAKIPTAN